MESSRIDKSKSKKTRRFFSLHRPRWVREGYAAYVTSTGGLTGFPIWTEIVRKVDVQHQCFETDNYIYIGEK